MRNKQNKYLSFLFLVILSGIISACIDPYYLKLDEEDSEFLLVVESLITNEPGSFEVKLSRSVPMDTLVNFIPESGATVVITDDENRVYYFGEVIPGVYRCYDNNARAETGRSYHLSIIDSDQKEYESTAVTMLATPEIKEFRWEENSVQVFRDNEVFEENGIDILVSTEDASNNTKYYKWDFAETWEVFMPNKITVLDPFGWPFETVVQIPEVKKRCWVTQESRSISIKSVENQENSQVDNFKIQRIGPDEDKLFIRYSVEVKQYGINKEMYEFWDILKDINENPGSIYDKVPAPTYGNISCCESDQKVLGYFNVADVKRKRIFIEKGEHEVITANYFEDCLYVMDPTEYWLVDFIFARNAICSDCREYGSNIVPDFW